MSLCLGGTRVDAETLKKTTGEVKFTEIREVSSSYPPSAITNKEFCLSWVSVAV